MRSAKIFLLASVVWFSLVSSFLYPVLLPRTRAYANALLVEDLALIAVEEAAAIAAEATDAEQIGLDTLQLTEETVTAGATVGTQTTTWADFIYTKAKDAAKYAWGIVRVKLLNMLVNDIVAWIQGGGTPRFITNPTGFLEQAGDEALGLFANKLAGANLCSDFRPTLNVLLPPVKKFLEKEISCTASDIVGNMDRMWEKGFAQGGWQNWIKLQQPQNNIFGAYLIGRGELADIAARHVEAKKGEALAGGGFLDQKECAEYGVKEYSQQTGQLQFSSTKLSKDYATGKVTKVGPTGTKPCEVTFIANPGDIEDFSFDVKVEERGASGNQLQEFTCFDATSDGKPIAGTEEKFYQGEGGLTQCLKEQTLTPGAIVGREASRALGIDYDMLISAKEVSEYVGAIVNAIINRVTREGLAFVKREAGSQSTSNLPQGQTTLTPFDCTRTPAGSPERAACETKAQIAPLATDPVQLIIAEQPFIHQFTIDLENFANELGEIADKFAALESVQQQIQQKEAQIAAEVAKIAAAARTPGMPDRPPGIPDKDIEGRSGFENDFVLPVPPQSDSACTLNPPPPPDYPYDKFYNAISRPAPPARQFDQIPSDADPRRNAINEVLTVALQGLAETISHTSLDKVASTIFTSIGSVTVDKTMTYEERVTTDACGQGSDRAEKTWRSTFMSPDVSTQITPILTATTEKKNAVIAQKDLIVSTILPGAKEYQKRLEYWNRTLGVQSGSITTDQGLLAKAMTSGPGDACPDSSGQGNLCPDNPGGLEPTRNDLIAGLQTLMAPTTATQLTDLQTIFIDFRAETVRAGATAGSETGNPLFPNGGGYYGQLAELDKVFQAAKENAGACGPVVESECRPGGIIP